MKKKNKHIDLGFEVPDGYFQTQQDRLFDELSLDKKPKLPFRVPQDYFNTLEERIIDKVCPTGDEQPFDVPAGYFDSLEERVMTAVQSKGSNKQPFAVPIGYFEQLEQNVLKATVDKPVVQLQKEHPAWMAPLLAVAAIIVVAIAINGFWPGTTLTLEDLNNEELAGYLAETDFTADQEALDILYTNTDVLDYADFETSVDNDDLLNYLADEVDMNQMMEE